MREYRLLFLIFLGGLLGAATGFFAGGFIEAWRCDWNVNEAGCVETAAYGTIIGSSILMPIGAQVANWRRRRSRIFLLTLLGVVSIAIAGLIATFATGLEWVIVAIPVLQLVSCVLIQWTTLRPSALRNGGL